MMTALRTMPSTLAEAISERERLPGDCFLLIEETIVKVDGRETALFAVGRDNSSGWLCGLGVSQDAQATCRTFCWCDSVGNWHPTALKGGGWPEQWIKQNADACFLGALRAVDALRRLSSRSRESPTRCLAVDHGQPW